MPSSSISPVSSLKKLSFDDLNAPGFLKSRGKRAPPPVGWIPALASMIMVPPAILLLSPIIILSQLANKLSSAPPIAKSLIPKDLSTIPNPVPHSDRAYDIIVLGATGFTGDLALQYLMKTYAGSDLKLAVAGRNANKLADKLKASAEIVGAQQNFVDSIGTIIVDTSSPEQIAAMVSKNKRRKGMEDSDTRLGFQRSLRSFALYALYPLNRLSLKRLSLNRLPFDHLASFSRPLTKNSQQSMFLLFISPLLHPPSSLLLPIFFLVSFLSRLSLVFLSRLSLSSLSLVSLSLSLSRLSLSLSPSASRAG